MAVATLGVNERRDIDMLSGNRPRVRRSMNPADVYELMRARANANSFFQNIKSRSQKYRFQTMVKDALELDRLNRGAMKLGAQMDYDSIVDRSKLRRQHSRKAVQKKSGLKKAAMGVLTKEDREAVNITVDLQQMQHLVAHVKEALPTKSSIKPIVRFRRAARAVFMIIRVCNVCRELLAYSVMQEKWYSLVDSLLSLDPGQSQHPKGRPRPFVTFFPDEKLKKIVQLSFDANEFRRGHNTEGLITQEVKRILTKPPGTRLNEEVNEVVKCVKTVSESFRSYSLDTQKKICQLCFYDRYTPNRVILRKGLPADGFYMVLTGQLAEHDPEKRKPREIMSGERFGEYDLICGCTRRTTVVTTTLVDLIYIHRFDYREIFNMSVDCNHPSQLDICRNNLIFRHFPMQRLVDNPGTWSVLKYKFGQLMVRDSNDIEWIYIIKSGEARVLKHMNNIMIDIKGRRKRLQDEFEAESAYHKQKMMLKFVSDQKTQVSRYRRDAYILSPSPRTERMRANTPTFVSRSVTLPSVQINSPTSPATPALLEEPVLSERTPRTPRRRPPKNKTCAPVIKEEDVSNEEETTTTPTVCPLPSDEETNKSTPRGIGARRRSSTMRIDNSRRESMTKQLRINLDFNLDDENDKHRGKKGDKIVVPPFLQIETLQAGSVFGFRACLDGEERGASASLVSSGCEVLQINKKFFIRHADEAVLTLIKVNCKHFPTQDELLDRLDTNFQWQEHKDTVLHQFCEDIEIRKGRSKAGV